MFISGKINTAQAPRYKVDMGYMTTPRDGMMTRVTT